MLLVVVAAVMVAEAMMVSVVSSIYRKIADRAMGSTTDGSSIDFKNC